jgi:acyl transferase domain-containing protein
MDPMLDEFRVVVEGLSFGEASIPMVSTAGVDVGVTDPEYWVRHVREAVRFSDAISTLGDEGVTRFLELGPDGVLTAMGAESADAVFVPAMRRDGDEEARLVGAMGTLHAHGVTVDWERFFAGRGARRVELPTYAFQHERYWVDASASVVPADDGGFWETVELGDVASFAGRLGLPDDAPLTEVVPALASWRDRRQSARAVDGLRYHVAWQPIEPVAEAVLPGLLGRLCGHVRGGARRRTRFDTVLRGR